MNARKSTYEGFDDAEHAAMKERAKELKKPKGGFGLRELTAADEKLLATLVRKAAGLD